MSNKRIFPTIMAGGPGTRLWPESRRPRPKPYLPLLSGGRSLLRATLDRIQGLAPIESVFVVSGKEYGALTREAAPELLPERVLLEPQGRDTAPCAAWAALEAKRLDSEAIMLMLPSDHLIAPDANFRETILRAASVVEEDPGVLVTLGVEPTYPATGYGYIERSEALPGAFGGYRVAAFHEKPCEEAAKEYLATGAFFWNAGIFVWKAKTFLDLLRKYEPEFNAPLDAMSARIDAARANGARPEDDPEFVDAFCHTKKISVDYAVLERAEKVCVIPANTFSWNDLGSFAALEELDVKDAAGGNVVVGGIEASENASRNYARIVKGSGKEKLVVFVGVDDLLVVDTGDALVVAKKGSDAEIKKVVQRLSERGLEEYL